MKLHIGGKQAKEGWTILDIEPRPEVDIVAPADSIPLDDGVCDVIYASHVLEHFPLAKAGSVLAEWRRVLKPGGELFLSVPDLPTLAELYLTETDPRASVWLMRVMYGGQTNQWDFHYVGWSDPLLYAFLIDAGFTQTCRVESLGQGFDDCSQIRHRGKLISLNVMAR